MSDLLNFWLTYLKLHREGPTFFEGLVDSRSEKEFDSKLSWLQEKWESFEKLRQKKSDDQIAFFTWFKKYHAEEIKSTMLHSAAGLGDPPSEFSTNDSEAINSVIKQFVKFKKCDWPVLNDKMKQFVIKQQEEVCKAMVGFGQYFN